MNHPKLTRYSKTSVNDRSVCTISCKVTMLMCFRSLNNETIQRERKAKLRD